MCIKGFLNNSLFAKKRTGKKYKLLEIVKLFLWTSSDWGRWRGYDRTQYMGKCSVEAKWYAAYT